MTAPAIEIKDVQKSFGNISIIRDLNLSVAKGERHFLMDVNPTAENIAKLIYDHGISVGVPVAEVTLWETENSFATYRG